MIHTPTTAGRRGPGDRESLLATKVAVPALRGDALDRPRLLATLDEAASRHDVVVVATPAGFGKTTLLTQWARATSHPVAWLSVDARDDEPARFWRYVAAALGVDAEAGAAGGAGALSALVARPAPPPAEAIVAALGRALAERARPCTLVLDDLHLVGSPAVREGIGLLLAHLPPGLRLVVASRGDAPLPLAALRAEGRLAELDAADLRFTAEEAARYLARVPGVALPPPAARTLARRTEGWVTGLRLAALGLRRHEDQAARVEAFSGDHRFVLDYLTTEVLDGQPADVREFLLATSVLATLNGDLCDAVTGRADGQAMIEELERADLFVVPLDDRRCWYRYHHLFAEQLRAQLARAPGDEVAALHRRAAAWYEGNDLLDDALDHLLAGGDPEAAADLVERHAYPLLSRGEAATLSRWAAVLPGELSLSRPGLLLVQAAAALVSGRVDEVDPLVDRAERAAAGAGDDEGVATRVTALRTEAAKHRGDAAAVAGLASRVRAAAMRAPAPADDLVALAEWARGNLAYARLLAGEADAAADDIARAVAARRVAGDALHVGGGMYALAAAHRAAGRLGRAVLAGRRGLDDVARIAGPDGPAAGMAHLALAEALHERDDPEATARAADGARLCRPFGYLQWQATGPAIQAAVLQAAGDLDAAWDVVDEAWRAQPAAARTVIGLVNPLPARRARLQLARGDLDGVARWLAESGVGERDAPSFAREAEHLLLARLLVARRAPGRALAVLDRIAAHAAAQGRAGSLLAARAVEARAWQVLGRPGRAVGALADAVRLAEPDDHVRPLLDGGAPLAELVDALLADPGRYGDPPIDEAQADYARHLLARLDGPAARPAPGRDGAHGGPASPPPPLTAREREVLVLLAAGRRNREIAGELRVSPDTVKKHVSHIFRKLSATNRTEAVARAVDLGLLGRHGTG